MRPKAGSFRKVVSSVLLLSVFGQWTIPVAAGAQTGDTQDLIQKTNTMFQSGEINRALAFLSAELQQARDIERLRMTYLLLIKGRILRADELFSSQSNYEGNHQLDSAKVEIRLCLTTPGLQHTRPMAEIDPPPDMARYFDEVRLQYLGSLKIEPLDVPGAVVVLRGDTLTAEPGEPIIEEDLAPGSYLLAIQAEGYRTYTNDVNVTPGARVVLTPVLERDRGPWPKILIGAAAGALIAVTAIILPGGENPPEPLPGPPDPPAKPRR